MKNFKISKKTVLTYLPILVIFIVFAYLRFYNLDHRIQFDWDQERDAFEIKKLVVDHKLTLIGPRVVNTHGFYLGPYYTYLLLPFYLLSGLHPIGSMYFVIAMDLAFFAAAFFVLKKIWNTTVSNLFLAFWTINHVLIGYDIVAWNVLPIPFGIMLLIYILHKLYEKSDLKYWTLLGFSLALFLNFHFQFIFLILFAKVFVLVSLKKVKLDLKKTIISKVAFLSLFLPLVAFDFRHDFINSKLFFGFFLKNPDQIPRELFSWIPVVTNALLPLTVIKNEPLTLVLCAIFIAMCAYLMKTKKDFMKSFYTATLAVLLFTPIFFMIYGKRPSEYYFVYLYPLVFLVVIDFFVTLRKTFVLYILLAALVILNMNELKKITETTYLSLYYKDQAVRTLKTYTDGKNCNVTLNTELGRNTGFNYLIEHHKIKQTGNYSDPLAEIVIPPQEGNIVIGGIGLKIPWKDDAK